MKCIDADKLISELRKHLIPTVVDRDYDEWEQGKDAGLLQAIDIVESLQQEQPEVQSGKFVFPKYLYARTKDNKTIDMSYAPQDMTAIEYIRNDSIEQERPEVDL